MQLGQIAATVKSKWSCPAKGRVKINFYGVLANRDEGPKAGAGVVIRDDNGKFIGAHSIILGVVLFVLCAKALACQGALLFASELGMNLIIVEGDPSQIV